MLAPRGRSAGKLGRKPAPITRLPGLAEPSAARGGCGRQGGRAVIATPLRHPGATGLRLGNPEGPCTEGVSSWTLSEPGSQLSHGGPPVIIECLTHGLAVTRLQQHCLSQTQSQSGGGGESSHYHRQCQSTMHDTVSQVQVQWK